jgi:predicted RNase H-like nuclease (RuvC/YqgF family)
VQEDIQELESKIRELSDTLYEVSEELRKANETIAAKAWDATEFEKDYVLSILKEKDVKIDILEIDNQALRDSRDMFQNRNAELLKTISSLKRKLQV